jgi:hypothetical protein
MWYGFRLRIWRSVLKKVYVLKLRNAAFEKQRMAWKGRIEEIIIIRYLMKIPCDLAMFKWDWMGINYFKKITIGDWWYFSVGMEIT